MNPSRGEPTPIHEHGRTARLVHVACRAMRYAVPGDGIDWGTGNGVVRRAVVAVTRTDFGGVEVGGSPPNNEYGIATCFDVLEHAH